MKNLISTGLCLLFLVFAVTAQIETVERKYTRTKPYLDKKNDLTIRNIAQGRPLNNYIDGGSFDCRKNWIKRLKVQGQIKGLCNENAIRDFLWDAWTQGKRGYIRANYFYIDASWTHHIFIEPDYAGKWRVRWRIVRASGISGAYDGVLDNPEIVMLEKTFTDSDWKLLLKDKLGRTVEILPEV
jgi:hypothetical protein